MRYEFEGKVACLTARNAAASAARPRLRLAREGADRR